MLLLLGAFFLPTGQSSRGNRRGVDRRTSMRLGMGFGIAFMLARRRLGRGQTRHLDCWDPAGNGLLKCCLLAGTDATIFFFVLCRVADMLIHGNYVLE